MNREQYLLSKISQEACELAKEASKTMLFGIDSFDPNSEDGRSNLEGIKEEVLDVIAAFELFMELHGLDGAEFLGSQMAHAYIQAKKEKTMRYESICVQIGTVTIVDK